MRFCGMCGGTLLPPSAPPVAKPERSVSAAPQPAAGVTATATRPPAPEQPQRVVQDSPSIAGPSFLGLNDAPASRKRANLGLDPHDSGSRNLNYLLEDEEEPRGGGGIGKFILIVLALLLAVGFGYLRWKNQLPWLSAGAKKPAATTQPADQTPGDTSTTAPPAITPEPQPTQNQASNPVTPNPPSPAQTAPGAAPSSSVTPPPATPAANGSAQAPAESAKKDSGNPPDNPAAAKAQPDSSASSKNGEAPAKSADSDSDESPIAAPEEGPAAKSAPPAAKPKAASKPVDSVAQAQKYLYGRGVSQDCDHGLRILKPLANEGNPKAMVEMGALYSAGLCTPRDLPTSYRWFAVALRKDPSNQQIQNDLQKLWGEMTQPERQLAIKLTQ
jgi:hypothetical protein